MVVGIHQISKGRFTPFAKGYIDILEFNHITVEIMDIQDKDFWHKYNNLDAFIYQVGHTSDLLQLSGAFMPILHQYSKIPIFPNYQTLWHFDDKIKQNYLAEFFNLEFVESWVYWDKQKVLDWIKECEYPKIFKLKGGAGSTNVILLKSKALAKKLIIRAFSKGISDSSLGSSWRVKYLPIRKFIRNSLISFKHRLCGEDVSRYWANNKNYVYFQKFLPNNAYDTRVTIIGNRAFAFRRFNRPGDFRASGSGRIDYEIEKIDLKMVEIAFQSSEKCGFQSMAYDFLYDDGKPKICEVSYTYQDLAVYKCPGYWDSNLLWHDGHYLPQICILEDLLNISLEQPKMDI